MYQVDAISASQGVGLWLLCACAFGALWYLVVYLIGDTDRRRTPLQNLFRRALALFRWAGAVLVGCSYALDAGLYGYYLAMRKPLPQPRSERIKPPADLPRRAVRSFAVPALWPFTRNKPERVA